MHTPSDRRCSRPSILLALLMAALPALAFADIFSPPPASPDRLAAEVVWQIHLPSSSIASYESYHLLEGRIYAMATDGSVVAVRAESGEVAWIRKLAEEGDTLWPPIAYHTDAKDMVLFARLNDVIGLDYKTGVPVDFVRLVKPAITPVSVAPGRLFVAQPNGRLAAYRMRDGYIFWRVAYVDQFSTPPVYAPAINAVVAIDEVGLLACLRNEHRTEEDRVIFKQNLRSDPVGEMAIDGDMLYLATENQTLHAIDMRRDEDSNTGDIVWQYRLAKPPAGGPILTASAIYQATQGGGLHRIAKQQGEFKNWFDPQARQFLAEWPEGVVVLRLDGTIALIGNDPARPLAIGTAGGFEQALSNTRNDAIFLTNAEGTIRCVRPAHAPPLELASFLQQANGKLPAEPDEPTEIDRLRESARKKRDKLAGITPAPEPEIPAAPTEEADAGEQAAEPPAAAPEPYDPLRSKRPVVR